MNFESKNIIKFFLVMFLFYGALSFVIPLLYWTVSKDFEQLTKLPFYISILAMIFTLYVKNFIYKDWFTLFLIFYVPFAFFWGVIFNDWSIVFLSHLFPYFLPLIGLSFGYLVARDYQAQLLWFYQKIPLLGFWLAVTAVLYYYSYKFGYLDYYGAGSLLVLPLLYFLVKKKYFYVILFLFLIVLSGKRSDLLSLVLALFAFGVFKRPYLSLLIFLPTFILIAYFLYNFGFLDRFHLIIDALISGSMSLEIFNEFSSNRINDVLAAIMSINQSHLFWIFGQGFGVTYTYDAVTYLHKVHYTHFSPVSYVLLGGLVLFIAVYLKLIQLVIYALKSDLDALNIYFVFLFFLSFLGGSIFFTNPFYWFVAGVLAYRAKSCSKNTFWTRNSKFYVKFS